MAEQKNLTEKDLRRMRDEVNRLYAESMARLREAAAANRKLRDAMLAVYPAKESNDVEET